MRTVWNHMVRSSSARRGGPRYPYVTSTSRLMVRKRMLVKITNARVVAWSPLSTESAIQLPRPGQPKMVSTTTVPSNMIPMESPITVIVGMKALRRA